MTRLAVLSDIHGNLPALQAVMADMQQHAIDYTVVAGDSINWGPSSRQVLEVITAQNWGIIRGNNEFYSLDFDTPRAPARWDSYVLPPFINQQLGSKWLNVIAGLPDTLSLRFRDAPPIRVFHGIPDNPWKAITPHSTPDEIRSWLEPISENTLIGAHSHIPMERHVDRWHIFNPGSVGCPLDGQFSASYMILDGHENGWELHDYRRIPFDYDALFAEFERINFVANCGIREQLIIEEYRTARLQIYPFSQWQAETYPDHPITDDLVAEFLALDDVSQYMPLQYQGLDGTLYRD